MQDEQRRQYEMTSREIELADARQVKANWIFYIVLALSAALVIAFVLYGVPWVNAVIDKWLQGR